MEYNVLFALFRGKRRKKRSDLRAVRTPLSIIRIGELAATMLLSARNIIPQNSKVVKRRRKNERKKFFSRLPVRRGFSRTMERKFLGACD